MPETDILRHPKYSAGPALFGPAGSINSDIIDHKFTGLRQVSQNFHFSSIADVL
jgi:hypothetical protein